jgi:hypothetical protein
MPLQYEAGNSFSDQNVLMPEQWRKMMHDAITKLLIRGRIPILWRRVPSELSAFRLIRGPDLIDKRRGGIALYERHYLYFSPELLHDFPFEQILPVVPALDMNVGPYNFQKRARVVFPENKRGVDHLERPDQHGPLVFTLQGTRGPLEAAHGLVAIDADD